MTDRNGPSSPEDPFRICADAFRDVNQGVSDADELTGDIARDDALVESLAHRRPVPGEIDEVTALLADWCARTDRRDHLSVGSWLDQRLRWTCRGRPSCKQQAYPSPEHIPANG